MSVLAGARFARGLELVCPGGGLRNVWVEPRFWLRLRGLGRLSVEPGGRGGVWRECG